MRDSIILIPARLNSTRLAGKVLLPLGKKTILEHVWSNCTEVQDADCVILTDSHEVELACKAFGAEVVMTSSDHNSGTERIMEFIKGNGGQYENFVNIQGDEPFMDSDFISSFLHAMKENNEYKVFTTFYESANISDFADPSVVKLVKNAKNEALYFSRASIPHGASIYNKHLGVYGYKKVFFDQIYFEDNPLKTEKLEQLNFLHSGESIYLVKSEKDYLGINTIDDYEKAQTLIK